MVLIYRVLPALLCWLASAASAADDPGGRIAAEHLIKLRSRECMSRTGQKPTLAEGQAIQISSEYRFADELDMARRAQVSDAGDHLVSDTLRSLGLTPSGDANHGEAVLAVTLFGTAKAWLYNKVTLSDPQGQANDSLLYVAYPDVSWMGIITLTVSGKCVCAETVRSGTPKHDTLYGTLRRTEAQAPYRHDLANALAPALLRLGKDLYGVASVANLATKSDSPQVRELALAQIHDQTTLAEIARHDADERLRLTAVSRLTDQSAMAEISRYEPSRNVRISAVRRLTDSQALSDVGANDNDADVRREAQARLAKLAKPR